MERPDLYAIDFGTSNSLLAAASAQTVFDPIALDPDAPDPSVLRSILFFPSAERCHYGAAALTEYVAQGMRGRLIRSIKKHLPARSFVVTYVHERPMRLEDLVAAMLREMRARANRHFDADVKRVLLGRPARFSSDLADDSLAQERLRRAAHLAGFEEVHFCPEPVAAARDLRDQLSTPRLVLVGDFGGGTSDFTIVRMRPDAYDPSDVLATHGVAVAGDALDGAIMRHKVVRHFGAEATYRVPMGNNVLTMPKSLMEKLCSPAELSLLSHRDAQSFLRDVRRWSLGEGDRRAIDQLLVLVDDALGFQLFEAVEQAKRGLSSSEEVEVEYHYPGIDVREPVTRADFERASERQTRAILDALDETLRLAGTSTGEIDLVCCTGGTARVPHLARALAARFGADKMLQMRTFHSVIRGLAERAQAIARS